MKSAKKSYITYALIMCALIIVCLAKMEVTGNNQSFSQNGLFMIVMMVAPVIIWFFGIWDKKKSLKAAGLPMTWGQGVREGVKISLAFGILSSLIFLFYYLVINPEIVESLREAYDLSGASRAKVIALDIFAQIFTSFVFGLVVSMIWSFFLKTRTRKQNTV